MKTTKSPDDEAALTSENTYCTQNVLNEQCKKTARNLAAIGDLIPTKKSTALTIQRMYFDDVPMPGCYEVRRDDNTETNVTVSAFPRNEHVQRWRHQTHNNTDEYEAHV